MPSGSLMFPLAIAMAVVTNGLDRRKSLDGGPDSNMGQALFLTPLIVQGQFEQAKEKCRVEKVGLMDFESCSGYLTVRGPPDDANLFFWFFPAVNNSANVPILLSICGGPGIPVFQTLFGGTGPYLILSNGTLGRRTNHWMTRFNIIYLDAPVGTGYSFASSNAAYNKNITSISIDIVEALQQFFTLFSVFANNDFYIMGESSGGKIAIILAHLLHTMQSNNSSGSSGLINLKGVIGFAPPLHYNTEYVGVADFLNINGLLTAEQYVLTERIERQFMDTIKMGNLHLSNVYIQDFFLNRSSPFFHYLTLTTGFDKFLSFTNSFRSPSDQAYEPFVNQAYVRQAIHVGSQPYHISVKDVLSYVNGLTENSLPTLNDLLNHGYRVLLAYGICDIMVVPLATMSIVDSLQWKGAAQFHATERVVWKMEEDTEVAGYVTPGQDLWLASVRHSGHIMVLDQPLVIFDIVTRFTRNDSIF